MTKICRLLLSVILLVVVQPYIADAAIENPPGYVTLVWTAQYTPFSWKFSVDPVTIENGSLSIAYELGRTAPTTDPTKLPRVQESAQQDYLILSQGNNRVVDTGDPNIGLLENIQFALPANSSLPSGDTAFVFDVIFDDLDPALTINGDTPEFTVFAGPSDGFNFPQLASGLPDFSGVPEIAPGMDENGRERIQPFTAHAPIPEPSSSALAWLGTLGVMALRRRR